MYDGITGMDQSSGRCNSYALEFADGCWVVNAEDSDKRGLAMNILVMTIPVTITLVLLFVLFFLLAVRSGQFDDLETPAQVPFLDEDDIEETMNDTK